MEWIYSNYDKESRLKNVMWTVSGDYSEELEKSGFYAHISDDLALYYAALAGARRKYINWKMVKGYLNYRVKQGVSFEVLLVLTQLCCDRMVEAALYHERPGLVEISKKAVGDLIEAYLLDPPKTLLDQVRYAVLLRQAGKHIPVDRLVGDIVRAIEDPAEVKDTDDVIAKIDRIYNAYFSGLQEAAVYDGQKGQADYRIADDVNKAFDQDDFQRFMMEEYYHETEDVLEAAVDQIATVFLAETMGSLRPDKNEQSGPVDRIVSMDEETAEKLHAKIEYYYGKSFLSKDEVIRIEKRICRNTHEGCRVHFTDGVLRHQGDPTFQTKLGHRQKENNMAYFNSTARVNRRNIQRLKENIIRMLAKQAEVTVVPSEYGVIIPNKLWMIGRTSNHKVFNKVMTNAKGGYVIDILLDASGSQRERQGIIAAQGYILSEALTLAEIPNRVMSFCSFLDYTILRRFRDYDSPRLDNSNIFEYQAVGNNRDGLAIRAVCEALTKRDEENKILIILSDGKPNDIQIAKNSTIRGDTSYRGFKAIKDTAMEVRKARKSGIIVLGVFTGKEQDLLAEKYIYGKDFIYTRDIGKFADIAGIFLKRVIDS
ncbi:nitric oxide reductase activation-like protein [Dehalobacter sp. DCM]|uniref:nitric oxide reductase activation-like protein n=1 Tax=Dehalobacter sp. DCM TaxID=2907827 RepID=UPI003081FFB4|nr:nitric oxide reductase activation-like protein [Dehalobacter sp. DCM]